MKSANSPTLMNRREALRTTALAAAAAAAVPGALAESAQPSPNVEFVLPTLPYAFDALEPHIDARTMEIHYSKHHAAYIANLNKALAQAPQVSVGAGQPQKQLESLLKNLNSIPEPVRPAVRNNAGGHYNHSLFWQMMKKGGGEPKGDVAAAIDKAFGGFAAFKEQFAKAALGQFGSGWAWLTVDAGNLKIEALANQDSPVSLDRPVLLGVDVWEHAYYLKYQNRRADYLAAWFNVVNWDFVADRYASLKG